MTYHKKKLGRTTRRLNRSKAALEQASNWIVHTMGELQSGHISPREGNRRAATVLRALKELEPEAR